MVYSQVIPCQLVTKGNLILALTLILILTLTLALILTTTLTSSKHTWYYLTCRQVDCHPL